MAAGSSLASLVLAQAAAPLPNPVTVPLPATFESYSPAGTPLRLKLAVEDATGKNLQLAWTIRGAPVVIPEFPPAEPAPGTNAAITRLFEPGHFAINVEFLDRAKHPVVYSTLFAVVDTTPPRVTCPPAVRLAAGPSGVAIVPNLLEGVDAADNGTPEADLLLEQNPAPGTRLGPGVHPITITATDAIGLSQSCTATLAVQDVTAPTVVGPPPLTVAAKLATHQAAIPNVLEGVAAEDNCTPENAIRLRQEPAPGTPAGVGTHRILVTATDAAGNQSQSAILLTVKDTALAQ